jgi:competence protein ComEC
MPSPESTPPAPHPQPDPTHVHIPAFMPFFWLGLAALVGALAADVLRLPWGVWAGLLGASLLALIWQASRRSRLLVQRKLPLAAVSAAFCLTALLYQLSLPQDSPAWVGYYNERGIVELTGMVDAPPESHGDTISLTVHVESLTPLSSDLAPLSPDEVHGRILLQIPAGSPYTYGDLLSIRGNLEKPSEGSTFSYREYFFHQGIYSSAQFAQVRVLAQGQGSPLRAAIYRLREHSLQVLRQIFPEPESGLLRGILLSDESGLSPEMEEAYALTGTAHIIAISGFNMVILASLVTALCTRRLGSWRGGLLAILVLVLYTVLVGASASVVRAAIMGSFSIIGASIRRRGNALNSLGLSILLMVLFNPHLPWDVGFQLSAAATLGLALFASPLQARLQRFLDGRLGEEAAKRLIGPISEYFLVTLAAQVFALPLIAFHFRQVSPLFLIANPLILPAQPAVMVLGLVAMTAGLLAPALGSVLAWLAWPFAAYTNRMVTWLAGLAPAGWQLPHFSFFWVLALYALILALTLPGKPKVRKLTLQPAVPILVLACGCILVWAAAANAPDGKLHVRVLSGAEKPVVLLRTGSGRFVLVGGSLEASTLAQQLGTALPPFSPEVDALVIPACGKADVSGLFGLAESFTLGKVYWGCDPERIQTTRRVYAAFQQAQIPQQRLQSTDQLNLGGAQLAFTFGEESLAAVQIDQANFHALINYSAASSAINKPTSVFIGPEMPPASAAQLTLLTAALPLEAPKIASDAGAIVLTSDYTWVETTSDGYYIWINGVK